MSLLNSVGLTSHWMAAARAVESRRVDRLFNDPFADALAGVEGHKLLARMTALARPPEADADWENQYFAVRTRFIDDFIYERLRSTAVRQIVLVASGLDTRAYRMDLPIECQVFELDQPSIIEFKHRTLAGLGAQPRCTLHRIGLNIEEPFGDRLIAAGFSTDQDALWIIEGLLRYLTEPSVRTVLAECASMAVRDSALVADVPGESLLRSERLRLMFLYLQALGAPWLFGTDEPEQLFGSLGWTAVARRTGEVGANYGRWPVLLVRRGAPGVPQSFFVTAVRNEFSVATHRNAAV